MKKTLLFLLFAAVIGTNFICGQVTMLVEAPQNNASTSGFRAPNGTSAHAYMRACALVLQNELTAIAPNTTLTNFGFTLATGATVPATGNFTVYLENTADLAYSKGTNYGTAISTMSMVYASAMTIPQAAGTCSILLTLSTPFVYTGGGLYVAYDWYSPGPYSAANAVYLAENGQVLNPGCASGAAAAAPAPTTLGTTAFRPAYLFGFANPFSNDVKVVGIDVPGRLSLLAGTSHTIGGQIRNISNTTLSNVTVSLNITGTSPNSATQIVPSLAPGAATTVVFGPYAPTLPGANSISVSVASDQNNTNNSAAYSQSITCNGFAQNPATGNFTGNALGTNTNAALVVSRMELAASTTLSSIRFAFSNYAAAVGNSIHCVLLNSSGAILATTNTVGITAALLTTFYTFSFAVGQQLNANTTYYYGFAQPANVTQYYPAGTFVTPHITPNVYFTAPFGGGALTPIAVNSGYPYMEAIFSPSMSVSASSSLVCSGMPVVLSVSGPSSYTWSTGGAAVTSGQNATVNPVQNTIYDLAGTSTLGCNYIAAVSVSVNPLPQIVVTNTAAYICQGNVTTFSVSGANSYSVNGIGTGSLITQTPQSSGTFTFSGTDGNGCIGTQTLDLTVNSLTVSVSSNTTVCSGKPANLSASGAGNYNYSWSIGQGFPFANATVSPTLTTVYTVTATDLANGCTQANTVTVTVNANPTVTANSSASVICKGHTATLTANGAATYSWSNNGGGAASITVAPQFNATYSVTGTDASGCTHTASVLQIVDACLGIKENVATSDLMAYPNPGTGLFSLKDNSLRGAVLDVFDLSGRSIRTIISEQDEVQIDLSDAPAGMYLFRVRGMATFGRLVKQ